MSRRQAERPRRDLPLAFVDDLAAPELTAADRHHLVTVRRLEPGAELTVSDGGGSWREARLEGDGMLQSVGSVVTQEPEPSPITVAFTPVKGERSETIIAHLVEIGVDEIIVLRTDRSIVQWDRNRQARLLDRWNEAARSAAAQSHRARLPVITGQISLEECLARFPSMALADPDGEPPGRTLRQVAVGPEGGWSPAEVASANPIVSLPGNILRAETAALVAATVCEGFRSGLW